MDKSREYQIVQRLSYAKRWGKDFDAAARDVFAAGLISEKTLHNWLTEEPLPLGPQHIRSLYAEFASG